MSRARNIKPGFFRNADLVELPMEARLLFIGLWTLADRSGRLEDRPKQIKMEIFPADSVDCDAAINLIVQTGMLERYEVDGKRYLQVVNFCKHQNPHRDEKASTIPEPVKHGASTMQAPCKPDTDTVAIGLTPESGFLNPDSLTVAKATLSPDGFDSFWKAYPNKSAKPSALKAFKAAKINGHLPEVLIHVGLMADSEGWLKNKGQFIPMPATYLNQRRWEDEAAPATAQRETFV